MPRVITFTLLIFGCSVASVLTTSETGKKIDVSPQDQATPNGEAKTSRYPRNLEHPVADSKSVFGRNGSTDMMESLLNCKHFSRFMETLKETQTDLLSFLRENPSESTPFQGKMSPILTRRAKHWTKKLKGRIRRVFRTCLSWSSLRRFLKQHQQQQKSASLSKTLPDSADVGERLGVSRSDNLYDKLKNALNVSNPKHETFGTSVQDTDKKLSREQRRKYSQNPSGRIETRNKRRRMEYLANSILRMLLRNGKIDVISLLQKLATPGENQTFRTSRLFSNDFVSRAKPMIGKQLRDVPSYFLSVAVGARIIQKGQLAKLASSPRFLTLTRGLSPAILRYGGTYANFVLYDPEGPKTLLATTQEILSDDPDGPAVIINSENISGNPQRREENSQEERERTAVSQGLEDTLQQQQPSLSRGDEGEAVLGIGDEESIIGIGDSDDEDDDCIFDFKWHSYYKTKPSEDSTYNLLEAMMAESEPDYIRVQDRPSGLESGSCDVYDVSEYTNFTMSGDDWSTLAEMADAVGMKLLFDINHFIRDSDFVWDPANALLLLQYASDRNDSVLWQLGNEPNSYKHKFGFNFTGRQDAQDFHLLRQELLDHFDQPTIVGPDVTRPHHKSKREDFAPTDSYTNEESVSFLRDFLSHLDIELTAISWHHYYIDGRTATVDDFLSVEVLDYLSWQIPEIVKVRDELAPDTPIWLTETSTAWGGGAKNLSNRYADGFPWMDKLGMAAAAGVDVVTRQTLYHGCYALIDDHLNPSPSYWLSYVYKTLVGERVLNLTTQETSNTTRLYAHCQRRSSTSYEPGNVVVFGMNLADSAVDVIVEGIQPPYFIEQYLMEPGLGDLHSSFVLLNGKVLEMTSDEQLPDLEPILFHQESFQIPPTTFGFWVFVDANVEDCYI